MPNEAPHAPEGDDAGSATNHASVATGAAKPADADVHDAAATPSPPPADGRVWYAVVAGTRIGPLQTDDVRQRLASQDLRPRHFVWRLGFGPHWYRIREVPEFRDDVRAHETDGPGLPATPDRVLCTNCFARVLPAWRECPTCGHSLKSDTADAGEADVLSRRLPALLGTIGATVMLGALALPWVRGATAGSEAGLAGFLGGSFAVLALALAFVSGHAAMGARRRAVLAWLLAMWAVALIALYVLHAPVAPGTIGAGLPIFAVGALLVAAAWLLPALHSALTRPVPALAATASVGILAAGHLLLVTGAVQEPLLRAQVGLAGYEVVEIARAEPQPDLDDARTDTTVYRVLARHADTAQLYVATVEARRGHLVPVRRLILEPVPPGDEALFEHGDP